MSKYFLHDGENQLGPFDKSQLKEEKSVILLMSYLLNIGNQWENVQIMTA